MESSLHRKNQVFGNACKLCRTRYKRSLLRTMLDRAKRLSSKQITFFQECNNLKRIFFVKLKYPEKLIDSTIHNFQHPEASRPQSVSIRSPFRPRPLRITVPFKDQKSVHVVRRRLRNLGRKIKQDLQPIFTSKEVMDELRITELRPPLVKQQNLVYEFNNFPSK